MQTTSTARVQLLQRVRLLFLPVSTHRRADSRSVRCRTGVCPRWQVSASGNLTDAATTYAVGGVVPLGLLAPSRNDDNDSPTRAAHTGLYRLGHQNSPEQLFSCLNCSRPPPTLFCLAVGTPCAEQVGLEPGFRPGC